MMEVEWLPETVLPIVLLLAAGILLTLGVLAAVCYGRQAVSYVDRLYPGIDLLVSGFPLSIYWYFLLAFPNSASCRLGGSFSQERLEGHFYSVLPDGLKILPPVWLFPVYQVVMMVRYTAFLTCQISPNYCWWIFLCAASSKTYYIRFIDYPR